MNSSRPTDDSNGKRRLLVVEDDAVDRMALRRTLAELELDLEVVEAATVSEAREALENEESWDWVVSDFQLPDGRGLDVLSHAAQRRPEAAVIILTGRGDESLAAELMRAGARDYIPKERLSADRLGASLRTSAALLEAERQAALSREGDSLLAGAGTELAKSLEREDVARAAVTACLGPFVDFALLDVMGQSGEPTRAAFAHRDQDLRTRLVEAVAASTPDAEWMERIFNAREVVSAPLDAGTSDPALGSTAAKDWLAATGATALFSVALRAREDLLGVLTFGRGRPYDELELRTLRRYAERVGLALDNAELFGKLRAALGARDDVLAFVAHDLRNPLNAILGGATNLLALELGPEARRKQLQLIETATRRMSRLVDDLLDVAKLEEGVLAVMPEPSNPGQLVEEAIYLMRPSAAERGVRLESAVEQDLPSVLVDRTRGIQVLGNLIDNAVRVSTEGGVVQVGAAAAESGVRFSVRDEGPGIEPDDLARLFERFWQSSSVGRKGRAGLGLTISRGLVELHGGQLEATSEIGLGTEFFFTIPAAPPPP